MPTQNRMKRSLVTDIGLALLVALALAPAILPIRPRPFLPRTPAAVVVVVIFSSLAIMGVVWSILGIVRGARTRRWDVARGTITRDGLDEKTYSGRYGLRSWYRAVIWYTFEVGGKSWTGHRVIVSDTADDLYSFRQAEARFDRYPSGTSVNVYFDPSDPSQSVLVPGIPWRSVLGTTGLFAGAIVFGLWLLPVLSR